MSDNPIERLKELADSELKKNVINLDRNIIDVYFDLFLEIAYDIKNETFIKGNVLLNKLLPTYARSTKDLDLSVSSKELYYSAVVPKLKEFGNNAIRNKIAERFDIKEIDNKRSGGITVYDKSDRSVYSVDVSLSELSLYGVVQYSFDGNYAQGSSIEKILCDKTLSTLSTKRFRRIKDFYDLYIIMESNMIYDKNKVMKLIIDKVGIEEAKELFSNFPFSIEIMVQATNAWDKLTLVRALDGTSIHKANFNIIISKVYLLYSELAGVLNESS